MARTTAEYSSLEGATNIINIDFQTISTGSPKTLAIMDTSTWGVIENGVSIVEITPPNEEEYITHIFEKGKVNVYNTSNLYLSSVGQYEDLPDGLYTIEVKGSPDKFCKKKYFLKDDKTKLELYKMYASLGADNDTETTALKKEIHTVEMLIRGANALVALGKNKRGVESLKRANEYLLNYNNCKGCN